MFLKSPLFLGVANVVIFFIKTNHNLFILFELYFLQRIPRNLLCSSYT